jgi:hypothetical protein
MPKFPGDRPTELGDLVVVVVIFSHAIYMLVIPRVPAMLLDALQQMVALVSVD